MQGDANQNPIVLLSGLSNQDFLERYASPGRIGLSGGFGLIDKAICRAERRLDPQQQWSTWSHAFVFQGRRPDGHHWLIESDVQVHRKHIQLGVQENRVSKYFDEELYTNLAVLDFGLTEEQVNSLLQEALEIVANRARYSFRELLGTLIALRRPEMRRQKNLFARERTIYCSAFVQHLFRKAGCDLAPGVDLKNTTGKHLTHDRAARDLFAPTTGAPKQARGIERTFATRHPPPNPATEAKLGKFHSASQEFTASPAASDAAAPSAVACSAASKVV